MVPAAVLAAAVDAFALAAIAAVVVSELGVYDRLNFIGGGEGSDVVSGRPTDRAVAVVASLQP